MSLVNTQPPTLSSFSPRFPAALCQRVTRPFAAPCACSSHPGLSPPLKQGDESAACRLCREVSSVQTVDRHRWKLVDNSVVKRKFRFKNYEVIGNRRIMCSVWKNQRVKCKEGKITVPAIFLPFLTGIVTSLHFARPLFLGLGHALSFLSCRSCTFL